MKSLSDFDQEKKAAAYRCLLGDIWYHTVAKQIYRFDPATGGPTINSFMDEEVSWPVQVLNLKTGEWESKGDIWWDFATNYLVLLKEKSQLISDSNGICCDKCNAFNRWAEPNQSNGKYICFECR